MLCNNYCVFEGGTILGSPDEVLDLGDTEVTQDVFMDFLSGIEQQNFRFVTKNPRSGGSSDRDDRRIVLGLKFSRCGFFGVGEFWQVFWGSLI